MPEGRNSDLLSSSELEILSGHAVSPTTDFSASSPGVEDDPPRSPASGMPSATTVSLPPTPEPSATVSDHDNDSRITDFHHVHERDTRSANGSNQIDPEDSQLVATVVASPVARATPTNDAAEDVVIAEQFVAEHLNDEAEAKAMDVLRRAVGPQESPVKFQQVSLPLGQYDKVAPNDLAALRLRSPDSSISELERQRGASPPLPVQPAEKLKTLEDFLNVGHKVLGLDQQKWDLPADAFYADTFTEAVSAQISPLQAPQPELANNLGLPVLRRFSEPHPMAQLGAAHVPNSPHSPLSPLQMYSPMQPVAFPSDPSVVDSNLQPGLAAAVASPLSHLSEQYDSPTPESTPSIPASAS